MKKILLLSILLAGVVATHAQKKNLTIESYKDWDVLRSYGISNDGKHVWYCYSSDYNEGQQIVLINNKTGQKKSIQAQKRFPVMTTDGNYFIYWSGRDSLAILNLSTNGSSYMHAINSVEEVLVDQQQILLARSGKQLIVRNLTNGREKVFDKIVEYKIAPDKKAMVVKAGIEMVYYKFANNETKTIAQLESYSNLQLDQSGMRLLFTTSDNNGHAIWYYHIKDAKARKLVDNSSSGITTGFKILEQAEFSPDGENIFFKEEKPQDEQRKEMAAFENLQLQLYHYRQPYAAYPSTGKPERIISSVSTDETPVIKHLTQPEQYVEIKKAGNKYLLVQSVINEDESYWNTPAVYSLIDLETGNQKEFTPASLKAAAYRFAMYLSPDEKCLLWHDYDRNHIFSYEIATGIVRNTTADIFLHKDITYQMDGSKPLSFSLYRQGPVWVDQGASYLVFDKYDLWQVDPLSKTKPINLTKGLGRENGIEFQYAGTSEFDWFTGYAQTGQSILLRAMDLKTKKNGIWSVQIGSGNISKGAMDDYLYQWNVMDLPVNIVKANKTGEYLLTRQSVEESKNIYITKDFKSFRKISDIAPEQKYNWITSELITYSLKGNKTCQGILYKPQNFDPSKKYPVIFYYYQSRSNELHLYTVPGLGGMMIDFPFYISKGYLVFVPDIINDKTGEIARTTVNAAESAVEHLSQFPWFDSSRIGLNGHSFGGYETNILATNSKYFKAAVASAAISDIITQSGSANTFGGTGLSLVEKGQQNINANAWERPDLYIENSPVFQTHKTTTPLLLVHGKNDGAVVYDQAYELFQALRRVQKPAWLLAYKDQEHGLAGEKLNLDLCIRVQQFFDHYLMGAPAPKWLTDGSYSLALNPAGKCSNTCPVCK